MGNRRRPKRPDLNLQHAALHDAAERLRQDGLLVDAWSDEPHADYPEATMEWIIGKLDDPQVNAYHCTICDQVTLTVDKHPGATPAFVGHASFGVECEGATRSAWYRVDQTYAVWATHEWYRPSRDELAGWHRDAADSDPITGRSTPAAITAQAMIEHVEKGGLALRRIPDTSSTVVEALARIGRSVAHVAHARNIGKTSAMDAAKAAHQRGEQARGYITDDDAAEGAGFKADELAQRRKQRETGGYRG